MKKYVCVVIVMCCVSCTKVIDINVRKSDIKYVIEGVITNQPGICTVTVRQSKQYDENNEFTGVSDAIVTVTDNSVQHILSESEPGVYTTSLIQGTPGHEYSLMVVAGGQTFTSLSVMPAPVGMDSLYVSRGPFGQFKFATIVYTDPAQINNGYRFVQYVNGIKEPTIFWENDEFTDGQTITMQLDASAPEKDDPRNIKSGDSVTVEMQTVDDKVFKYWYSLRAEGGDGDGITAAPSNPISNRQGGALGYFSAHTVQRRSAVAP